MTKKRRLTDDEIRLWTRFTADIKPIAREDVARADAANVPKPKPKRPDNKLTASVKPPAAGGKTEPPPPTPIAFDPAKPSNTDRRTWQCLKRGQIDVEGRLDLHGRTQTEAHDALERFLRASSAKGLRCVLIVTGKGSGGQGILRQMVPRWLAEKGNREMVITYCPAQPRDGGDGALYVLIRRNRKHR